MRRAMWLWIVVVALFGGSLLAFEAKAQETKAAIDPEAENVVQALNKAVKGRTHVQVFVEDTIDEVLETGEKIQYSHLRTMWVSRPNKMRVDTAGDIDNRSVIKNDKTFTLLDKNHNVYGQIDAPGSIDETLTMVMDKYAVTTPLADLMSENIYKEFTKNVKTGSYVGLHQVGEIKCHHLAFTQENIDWQVWVDAGDVPRIRKLIINYKTQPGQPQYTVRLLSARDFSEEPKDVFNFTPPKDSEKIEFVPAEDINVDEAAETE